MYSESFVACKSTHSVLWLFLSKALCYGCWLTMRPGLFFSAFMSPRLGPYVKYTFESWFLLFLTVELTKEDSCCALWNLCSGIFFDRWYPRDAACSLNLCSLGEELDLMQQNPVLLYSVNKVRVKGKKQKQNRAVTLGRHTQFSKKCRVTDCYSRHWNWCHQTMI